jgi:predicted neuraminidase
MKLKYLVLLTISANVVIRGTSVSQGLKEPFNPKIIYKTTVYKHPSEDPYAFDNHFGFNHAPSVTLLPDGRLLAAWFSGPHEASVKQVIQGAYSSDEGKTWTKATVLQDFPHKSNWDPAFIENKGRTWFFFSAGRWDRYPFVKNESEEVGVKSYKTYYRTSDDSGRTWSAPVILARDSVFCRSNGIKLSTGELLLPVYMQVDGKDIAAVMKSVDDGKTWKQYGYIISSGDDDEPTIAELKSGDIMMIPRSVDGFLWKVISKDKGETWSEPVKTDMLAAASSNNLFRLKDGHLLLTHDESTPPLRSPLTMRISSDDGETWSDPYILAQIPAPKENDVDWGRQVSYPSVVQLKDGTLVVVWARLILSDDKQYGDIECARIKLPK